MKNTMPALIKKAVRQAIKELAEEQIVGSLYHFKRKECSCCFGADNVQFQVYTNDPSNYANYYGENDTEEYKIVFDSSTDKDKLNATRIYFTLQKHLKETNYFVNWNGDTSFAMFIQPK